MVSIAIAATAVQSVTRPLKNDGLQLLLQINLTTEYPLLRVLPQQVIHPLHLLRQPLCYHLWEQLPNHLLLHPYLVVNLLRGLPLLLALPEPQFLLASPLRLVLHLQRRPQVHLDQLQLHYFPAVVLGPLHYPPLAIAAWLPAIIKLLIVPPLAATISASASYFRLQRVAQTNGRSRCLAPRAAPANRASDHKHRLSP